MKPANTITTAILVSALAAGLASAQSPSVIQNTRNTMNAVSNKATAASNEALGTHQRPPGSNGSSARSGQVQRSRGCAGEAAMPPAAHAPREQSGCETQDAAA